MSKPRRSRAPLWLRIAVVAAVIALAALIIAFAIRLFSGTLSLMRSDGGELVHDPQFAEPAEMVTRPPELTGEDGAPQQAGDPSDGWDVGEQTPVDKTASELSREIQP